MLKSAQIIILQHPKPKHSQPSNLAAAILGLLLAIGGIVEANPLTINQPLTQRAYQQCGEQSINSPHILLSYYNNVDGEPLALCYRDRVVRPLYQRPNIGPSIASMLKLFGRPNPILKYASPRSRQTPQGTQISQRHFCSRLR